jgi:hypothetical protein
MVCTWYNKVLWAPVLNKTALGKRVSIRAGAQARVGGFEIIRP